MSSHRFDDEWFLKERGRLLEPLERPHLHGARRPPTEFYARTWRSLFHGSRLDGEVHEHTHAALKLMAPRHAAATRAHMQFFRACLETLGLVPSDALVNAAVQVEWLWYTTPFKGFYRDHLAHVMKVALTACWLLDAEDSPLAHREHNGGAPKTLADRIAAGLAEGRLGSPALRAAAAWCGIEKLDATFWKSAVRAALRIAGLLHDMAYPDVMSLKVRHAAEPATALSPYDRSEDEECRRAVEYLAPHLVMAPFSSGRPGALSLREESRAAAQAVFRTSHSLRGAYTLLRFMETTHTECGLDSFDAFVLEWAALAVSLHDYDKLHESEKLSEPLKAWAEQNRQAIRPCFKNDPVSYLLALADQLQEFGRMLYVPGEGSAPDANRTVREVRYPCTEVILEAPGGGAEPPGNITFVFGAEDQLPFGARKTDVERAAEIKIPKEHAGDPIFGPQGWLDHSGLLGRVDVEVRHGEQLLRTSAPR